MARKVLLILFLFCILGNSGLWAEVWEDGLWYMGSGVVALLLPSMLSSVGEDEGLSLLCYICGGVATAGGLIGFVGGLMDIGSSSSSSRSRPPAGSELPIDDFSSRRKINPIIKHLSIGVLPNKVFVGANFRF